MNNFVVSLIILAIVAFSISRMLSDKRKGRRCGGCPDAGGCSSNIKNNKLSSKIAAQKIDIKEVI